jgi:hypothetical protein
VTTDTSGGDYHYSCYMTDHRSSITLNYADVYKVPVDSAADSVMEVLELEPGNTPCADYPTGFGTVFQGISITTSSDTPSSIAWNKAYDADECGDSAALVSETNPGGRVAFYYPQQAAISGGPGIVEVAGSYSYYAGPLGTYTYQWSQNGSQLGTGEEQSLYVDATSDTGWLGVTVTDTLDANLQRSANVYVSWDPITSASLGQMDDGEEPCIWIGAPLASDGYDPGGIPPYTYQWSSSDGALSQTDSLSICRRMGPYCCRRIPPRGGIGVTRLRFCSPPGQGYCCDTSSDAIVDPGARVEDIFARPRCSYVVLFSGGCPARSPGLRRAR